MNQQQKLLKILLIGDSCYDYYHYGEVKRISPEAPIPIFDHKYTEKKLGMMSNVLENFCALGVYPDYQTHFFENKNRYIDTKSKQQLLRVDQKITESDIVRMPYDLIDYDAYDAIVISDYGKGFFDRSDYTKLRENFKGPIFIDTKDIHLDHYKGAIIKINQHEYEKAGQPTSVNNLIVTYGGEQVIWYMKRPDAPRIFFPPKVEAHDVCGAGDTFLAALVIRYMETNDMSTAIEFAMRAAAVTIKHIGVYSPTRKEIEDAV